MAQAKTLKASGPWITKVAGELEIIDLAADLDILLVVGAGVQDRGQGERGQQGEGDAVTPGHRRVRDWDYHDRAGSGEVAT